MLEINDRFLVGVRSPCRKSICTSCNCFSPLHAGKYVANSANTNIDNAELEIEQTVNMTL
eukprot:m.92300 g.92300  ORF g.92300 m.92300 type:complete len:60 (+) comp26536_c1_seq1:1333-1512(+)